MVPSHLAFQHRVSASFGIDGIVVKNARCWARKLDDCCTKISGDHIISVNAWPGANRDEKEKTPVRFQRGLVRADGTLDTNVPRGFNRSFKVNNLKANVLCKDHNSRLWEADNEAGTLTETIAEFWDLYHKRWIPGVRYNRRDFYIDGPRIERWFIKSVLAYVVSDGLPIGSCDAEPGTPTAELVDIAFGQARPTGHIGLCGAATIDSTVNESNDFPYRFMSWSWSDKQDPSREYVAGALCFYRGLQFVLNLDKNIPPPVANLQQQHGWAGIQLLQPLKLLQAPSLGLYIHFEWPEPRHPPSANAPRATNEAA